MQANSLFTLQSIVYAELCRSNEEIIFTAGNDLSLAVHVWWEERSLKKNGDSKTAHIKKWWLLCRAVNFISVFEKLWTISKNLSGFWTHYLKGGTKGANSDNIQTKKNKKIKRILYCCWFDIVPLPFGWNFNTFNLMCTDQERLWVFEG